MRGFYKLPTLIVALMALAACSLSAEEEAPSNPEPNRELTIAHSSWEESAALAYLTEAVLEDELGYEVELEAATPERAFEEVATGEADAFQGIWRPRHNELISAHEGDIDMLGGWLLGTTRASLAAPSYMDIRRMDELEGSGAKKALVLGAGASGVGEIPAEAFEKHGLEPSMYSDSSAMMDEVERLYEAEEPFVMLAYSPHWMNIRYDLDYLEDGEFLEEINRPSTLHSATRSGLSEEDPLAYAFLEEITLTVPQMESLQLEIRNAEDPSEGARAWAAANKHVTGVWVYAARERAS